MAREGKEKTPKADREKVKPEEKSSKDDKAKAGNGEPMEPSRERDVIKESKSKEKGDRSAVAASLKSPVPRSESAETERGKKPSCYTAITLPHTHKMYRSFSTMLFGLYYSSVPQCVYLPQYIEFSLLDFYKVASQIKTGKSSLPNMLKLL